MKKKKLYFIGIIVFILIIPFLILVFFHQRELDSQEGTLTDLRSVSLCIISYTIDHNDNFPESLDFITESKILPELDIKKIVYTCPKINDYKVEIPPYNDFPQGYDGKIWFYYPYKNKAWVCVEGGAIGRERISLSSIKFKGKPIAADK